METQIKLNCKKSWIKSIQGWSWIITIIWMTIANIWKPFGLFGFVCMFTPVIVALSGRGKMYCARVCPRGSFIGFFTRKISIGLKRPKFIKTKTFCWILLCVMMGNFTLLIVRAAPEGIDVLGSTILIFMEIATALGFLFGVIFTPRSWCTICPMGFITGIIRKLMEENKKEER